MSRIEQLIAELCPDGVEYKELGYVCEVLRGKRLTKKELSENEKYPVYHGGLAPLGFYSHYNRSGNTVMIINVGASAGTVGYCFVNFWSSDGCFCIEPNDLVISRYLYYILICREKILRSKVRAAGIPTLDALAVENVIIPIPPLPIQQEIVRVLDTFTDLDAELQAELEARKKQYEHYRNQLLNFEGKEVEWKTLGDIVNIQRGVRVVRNQLLEVGKYPVYQNSMKPLGYFDKNNYKANTTFIIGAGAAGDIGFSKVDFWAADDCFLCLCPDNMNNKFLYYFLLCNQTQLYSRVRRASVPRLSRDVINKIRIPIPPLHEQERIVSILDKFEALVNDELPAEIAARRKQYEYYREKLLTFKPLVS